MSLASLIGHTVLRLMVHQRMSLSQGGGEPYQCFGAVALWFKDTVLVLRSQLRYSSPRLADLNKVVHGGGPTVSVCSHEEAKWLMQAIGANWSNRPVSQARLTAISATASALRLETDDAANHHWLTYREDLDACWVLSEGVVRNEVTEVDLLTASATFGWLFPESPYGLAWDGRNWSTLAAAWACAARHTHWRARDRLFQDLYWLRLRQHPNLLRRFAVLRYPVRCDAWPWLATQIAKVHQRAVSELPSQFLGY